MLHSSTRWGALQGAVHSVGVRSRSVGPAHIRDENVPRLALLLGASGLTPFVWYAAQHRPMSESGAAPPWGDEVLSRWERLVGPRLGWAMSGDQAVVRGSLVAYGAVILSFCGAVHWGCAMSYPLPGIMPRQLAASMVPALLGWGALLVDHRTGHATTTPHAMLSAGFLGVYLLDEWALSVKAVPAWYTHLRTPLTVAVVTSFSAAGFLAREKGGPPA
jgi:hypothetical protein